MRILWVKVGGLWPLHTGGRLRSFHILSELSRHHRVILATTHGPDDDPEGLAAALPRCERVISVPHAPPKLRSPRFAASALRSLLSPLPLYYWRWRVTALRRRVMDTVASGDVDLCVADFLHAISDVPLAGPVPVILFDHNVEHMIWKRLSRIAPLWQRALLELEWRKVRDYEAKACAQATLTIAVSEADRMLLTSLAPGAKVCTIPTGVDTAYISPNGIRETHARLVFTGSMDWYPNEDAILYFIDAILPSILREIPETTLTIVGRNPSARVQALSAKAGVRVTGTVDDVRPYIAEAAVCIVPLRVGGGTRIKIFESLTMAKPVVSTTVGAEGLPLIPGVHFLRADDPTEFARAVVSLLRDPARRNALGGAGRRLVTERYSWAHVARQFEARCRQALS